MKKLILMLLVTAVLLLPEAVRGQVTFQKTFGAGTAYCIKQTSDGNYIVVGGPFFLMKMDQNGNILWYKNYTSVSGGADAYAVEQTADGGYIITGVLNGGGPTSKVLLVKVDASGNFLWAKSYGGSMYEVGQSVKQTFDGGYVLSGYTRSFGQLIDVYVIKTDSNGDTLWSRNFGSNGFDYGNAVLQSPDSGYVVCGSISLAGLGNNALLTKLDKNGNIVWINSYGSSGDDRAYSIVTTSDGGYALSGWTTSFGAGAADHYLLKVDSVGNLSWSKTFGGLGNDYNSCVIANTDGGFLLTGSYFNSSASDVLFIKTDSNGDTLLVKAFGDNGSYPDMGFSAIEAGKGFISVGYAHSFSSNDEIYLVKTDSLGVSGCNQSHPSITVTSPATSTTIPSVSISSPATVVSSLSFTASNANTVSTLCSLVSVNETPTDPFSLSGAKFRGIYNMLGQPVPQGEMLPDGIYFERYEKDGQSFFKRMPIVR